MRFLLPLVLLTFPTGVGCQERAGGAAGSADGFVRFVTVGDGGHLDTAVTTYRRGDVEVVFYAAVHIGDPALYAALNDRFTTCDVLLYELVAAPDQRPSRGPSDSSGSPVSLLQQMLRSALELAFQLEEIDYQAANFVHADMTPEEFEASMAERGESLLSIMWQMMVSGMQMQRNKAERDGAAEPDEEGSAKAAPFDIVKAFRDGEGRHRMRMMFASQLQEMEALVAGSKGSTLLEGRNEKCLQVLQRELDRGRKRIGIYYGAAHLPHLEQRLVDDLGFRRVGHEWLVAWDCSKRPDPKIDRELLRVRRRCREELQQLAVAARDHRQDSGAENPPTPRELAAIDHAGAPRYRGPLADPWGTDYALRRRSVGTRWEAVSAGPDGEFGTEDDLVVPEPRRGGLLGR